MADEHLLDRLRAIAKEERTSLAEVIRQGLEWRAHQARRPFVSFGVGESKEPPYDTAERSGDTKFEPRSWRS